MNIEQSQQDEMISFISQSMCNYQDINSSVFLDFQTKFQSTSEQAVQMPQILEILNNQSVIYNSFFFVNFGLSFC